MDVSPSRTTLYSRAGYGVILLALALLALQAARAQIARGAKVDQGPRAIGLLQLTTSGQVRLIPIAIMVDGKFYDASAYKAAPVPMALWAETVYDVEKTGVSQGLFTVTGALQNEKTNSWIAEGRWETAAALAAKTKKNAEPPAKPRGLDDDSGPPTLRHSSASKPTAPDATPAPTTVPAPSAPSSPPQTTGSTQVSNPPPAAPADTATESAPEPEDPNRPQLKRGKQPPRPQKPESAPVAKQATDKGSSSAKTGISSPPTNEMQLIPAISDADGPDSRNYAFPLKPGEEQDFQKKILALATTEVRAKERQMVPDTVSAPARVPSKGKSASKASAPKFDDIQLRVFDLANNNDATLVLTAQAEDPQTASAGENGALPRDFMVTVVARQDLNGDLHKVFSNVTDAQHLDVSPNWELVDAVDANGDGAGELLFRKRSASGSAYAIYRVIGNQLYPLYEGVPGE